MGIIAFILLIVGLVIVGFLSYFLVEEGSFDYEMIPSFGIFGCIAAACFVGAMALKKIILFQNEYYGFIGAVILTFAIPIIIYNISQTAKRRKKQQAVNKDREVAEKVALQELYKKEEHEKQVLQTITALKNSPKYQMFIDFMSNNINYVYAASGLSVSYSTKVPLYVENFSTQKWELNPLLSNSNVRQTKTFFFIEQTERNWTSLEREAVDRLIYEYFEKSPLFRYDKHGSGAPIYIGAGYIRIPPNTNVQGKRPY